MTSKHYAILAAFLTAVAIQIGGLEHGWHDATTPQFVSGLLLQLGTTVGALFMPAPAQK